MKFFFIALLCLTVLYCSSNSGKDETNVKAAAGRENIFQDRTLQQIYTLQNQRDSRGLLVYLQDKKARYREAAAIAFASVQAVEAVEALATLLDDENEAVRCAAAYALGQIKNQKGEALLIKAWQNQSSAKVKKDILEAIGKCGTEKGLAFITGLEFAKDRLLLLTGQAWGIYRFSLQNIVSPKGTALAVGWLSQDTPEKVRFIAAHYLGRTRGIDLNPYVEQLLRASQKETNPFIAMVLVSALGKAPQPGVLAHLQSLLTSGEQVDYRIRVNALRALGNFNYSDVKDIFLQMVSNGDGNIAVTASEYFLANGTGDARQYFEIAQKLYDWRTRANMLAAALKYAIDKKDKKRISDWTITAYKKSVNNYEKAFLLKALAGDINNLMFIESRTFNNLGKNPVISTYGIDALVEMCRTVKDNKELLKTFADIFKRAIESGDPALILYTANILREPAMNFKEVYQNIDFLSTALNQCSLPEDLEGWLELRKTIDFFKGTQVSLSPLSLENHPLDWKLVTSITPDQQIRIKTSKGDIIIRLLVNEAPGSVANFVALIKENFFKEAVFHRVAPNFVIQGGCPRGDGVGGPPFTIGSELPPLYYEEGSVGMASAGKDTEGSQWFITHSPTPHLDGRYTIFAKVTAGMETVHSIQIGDKILGFEFH